MTFSETERLHVQSLMQSTQIFNGDPGNGNFRGNFYPFVLQDAEKNLFASSKTEICNYVDKNNIGWWNGSLPNHTLSSQVSCFNHLFPIRDDKKAVLSIVKAVDPKIVDVLKIKTDQFMPAYIQFEAISDKDHLNENILTRGSNCTSVDALIYGVHEDGKRVIFPIEWKYTEVYANTSKQDGQSGETRKKRYDALINASGQMNSSFHDVYYYEPFYQLMRQTLWAEQMIINKNEETIKADDFIHLHVVPKENKELLNKTYPATSMEMEASWRNCLIDQSKYKLISLKELLAPVNYNNHSALIEYLRIRYW